MSDGAGAILVSVVLTGRNDNYGGLFLERLALAVNYFAYCMSKLIVEINYEIIIVDWCSENKISSVLKLTKPASSITRFIHISEEDLLSAKIDASVFNGSIAFNAGMVRARGEYILHMPADILFTSYSLDRLCAVLLKKIPLYFNPEESLLLIKRCIIPFEFKETTKEFTDIERYLSLSTNWLDSNRINGGITADFGALVCRKEIWCSVGGFDESMGGWGKNDSRFGFMAGVGHPQYELSGFGVWSYDPTVDSVNIRKKLKTANKTCDIVYERHSTSFGMQGVELKEDSVSPEEDLPAPDFSKELSFAEIDISAEKYFSQIKRLLPFNAVCVKPHMYPLIWYMKNYQVDVFCEFAAGTLDCRAGRNNIMLREESLVSLVSAINPSSEIISILPQKSENEVTTSHNILGMQYLNKKGKKLTFMRTLFNELFPESHFVHKWHSGFAAKYHHGLIHYITGEANTAISRIRKRFGLEKRAQLILLRMPEIYDSSKVIPDALEFAADFALIIIVDPYNSVLNKISEIVPAGYTTLVDPISNICLVFKVKNAALLEYEKNKFTSDSKSWKNKFLLANYLKCVLFSSLTFLKSCIKGLLWK